MKLILLNASSFLVVLLTIMSCGKTEVIANEVVQPQAFSRSITDLPPTTPILPAKKDESSPKTFTVQSGTIALTARIDSWGLVTILDYPTVWRGRAKLIRYDGQDASAPFSKEHCEDIRSLAVHGQKLLVRNGYHSRVSFEMPFFLTSEFIPAVLKAANDADIPFTFVEVANPPITSFAGTIDFNLKNDSISGLLGDMPMVSEQLNLSRKGSEGNSGYKNVIVMSGDILCDLALNKAEMIISYPIKGENRVVKTVYDVMEVSRP